MVKVLIDTWWNVNIFFVFSTRISHISFNRYMVECELATHGYATVEQAVLIDTWWNVNACTYRFKYHF